MKANAFVLLLSLVAVPVYAQGTDDCPPTFPRHAAFTGLDDASLTAAITASVVGIFHRLPTGEVGAGADDVGYWLRGSNHYGAYSDNVCRAGWNLYRENQLGGLPTGPADGDKPARFQPNAIPPTPAPLPVPAPTCDVNGLAQQIDALGKALAVHDGKQDQHVQSVESFQADVRHWRADILTFIAKYGAIIGGTAYATCKAAGGC